MNNEELLKKISLPEEEQNQEASSEEDLPEEITIRYLVVRIKDKSYALRADEVQEISSDHEIFFVPFVPPYVRGYINRHGRPFTVFDLHMLFDKTPLEAEHFLILKRDDDQAALLITDVEELLQVPESQVFSLEAEDEISRYFRGALKNEDQTIFILDPETIMERLERDIERS